MRKLWLALACLLACLYSAGAHEDAPASKLDHSLWNELLQHYETPQARVDYRSLKASGSRDLQAYLKRVAAPWPNGHTPNERKAALINAYNALTVGWIVQNYPVQSIWSTSHPFTEVRHTVDGRKVSLDQIETELRNMGDPRVHAALVCASLSCPPLRREAYQPEQLDEQLDSNVRAWLRDKSLNTFHPASHQASISMIFDWYKGDFQRGGGSVAGFLARFAPEGQTDFLRDPEVKLHYLPYRWGLNDSTGLGYEYSKAKFLADYLRNKL